MSGPLTARIVDVIRLANALKAERDRLAARVAALEQAIIAHRSQKADDRCIEDDDRLYEALGDGIRCDRRVGSKEDMLANCKRFIERRCEGGGWPTYAELEMKLNQTQQLLTESEINYQDLMKSSRQVEAERDELNVILTERRKAERWQQLL